MIKNLWRILSDLGIQQEMPIYEQKSIILMNQLAMMAFPLTLFSLWYLPWIIGTYTIRWFVLPNVLLPPIILLLSYYGQVNLARFLFSVVPTIVVSFASAYTKSEGYGLSIIIYILPRLMILTLSFIPLVLFGFQRLQYGLLAIGVAIFNLSIYEFIHQSLGIDYQHLTYISSQYPLIWFGSGIMFLFIGLMIYFLHNLNLIYENRLHKQKDEIEAQRNYLAELNEELNQQKEEIYAQAENLREANQLITREKEISEKLLLNILPEETAQELKETGTATPKHYDLVSVLFTDFKGFTQITEKLDPQQVIEELNKCFLAFDEICEKHNLEKIKTIGDSYMCAGGIPLANTSNPIDCVQAGIEMQTWMGNWKAEKQAKGELAWELRLGIHSGAVVAGVIGKNKFAYDIWGDAVNLASRMESSGEAGKVNISGATYELVKDKFACTYRGKIEAKNKGEVEMYFVENKL